MPSLFDIGKSGLQAYRQSLAVTGQNIANVNTDGYKKRDINLEEVSGAGGGVTEISDQSGLGVRVEQIRRAFDEFLIDKARQASSLYKKADSYSSEVKDLENVLLPSDANLSSSIGDFFNSLQDIAAYPDDQAARIVAVEKGKDMAAQFNLYADRIGNLKDQIIQKSNNSKLSINLLTQQISNINAKILASGVTTGGSNALLDQRDLLLDQLSEIAQISVSYGDKGQAEVRLGNTGSGPIIVSTDEATKGNETTSKVDILNQGSRLQPVVGASQTATNQIKGGIISGMVDSFALADDTLNEIDNLAKIVSQKFNEVNQAGLNLEGKVGPQMFTVSSLKAIENPTNRSSVGVNVFVTDPTKIKGTDFKIMYHGDEDLWKLTSDSLKQPLTGKQVIEADGFKVSFFGQALDGDEFSIEQSSASKGMTFLLERPQDFAAASKTLINASSSNIGSAKLEEIAPIKFEDKTTISNLNNVFTNGLSPVISSNFSTDGGAAVIQAGTSFVNLSSYQAQPEIQFGLSASDLSSLTSITVTMADSSSISVSLTGIDTIEGLANVLNSSRDVSGNAHSFRSMGLYASGGGSTLTIASNNKQFSSGAISAASTINANVINPAITSASNLQILTREGRHIAGTVLSDAEIAEFLTEENGFNQFAEYRADYLNGTDKEKYRNIEVSRSTVGGNYIVSYGANGSVASAQRAATVTPASHVTAAYTLTVNSTTTGKSKNITVPIESSAGYVAGLINSEAKTLGVESTGITRVKISAPTNSGTISFNLKSKPGIGNDAAIDASVLTTDLTNLANSINNFKGRTGVTANLSSDKKHIILENLDGDDIELSSVVIPNALTKNTSSLGSSASTTISYTSHGFETGDKIIYTAGGTTLGNLTSGNTYYAIKVDANSFKLASSVLNASGGTAITVGGSGGSTTDKFTPPMSLEVLNGDFSNFSAAISVDIDGQSYKAARLSGELRIESSSSISTSNDGGTTTVTGVQDALRDGFIEITSSSTGEIKTLKPVVLDGDFSTSHPEGLSASSSILSYGLTLPATDSGSDFTTTVDVSALENLTQAEVSKKIVEGLRTNSPSIEILGKSIDTLPADGSSFRVNHDGLTYTLTMRNGEVEISGGEKDLLTAYFEDADPITINTTSLGGTETITSAEHNLETGDAIIYNAAEKVTVDTTQFSSTSTISVTNSFSNNDPIVYKAGGSLPISGLVDGTTYFVKNVSSSSFQLAATSGGAAITITGGTGGSVSDTFSSPRGGLVDGNTYYAVKVDDHSFKLASNYTLATNATPSVITIGASGLGGNAADSFDPGKNLYISAGKTISASQFSFPVDSTNDTNAKKFGMEPDEILTTITGTEITTPTVSGSTPAVPTTHMHFTFGREQPYCIGLTANTETVNTTSAVSSNQITAAAHGFKTGDKIHYDTSSALNGLSNDASYYAVVTGANTFKLASSYDNATADIPVTMTIGGSGGHASDKFTSVIGNVYNDDFPGGSAVTNLGISIELNQSSDTKLQISIVKEADKSQIVVANPKYSANGGWTEGFGFKTNQTNVNVINDGIRIQSFSSEATASKAVNVEVPANSVKSLVGNNLSISNLPPEDLIVVMTGNGSRKIASNYGEVQPQLIDTELKVLVDSTNNKKVEILDNETGHTLATRLVPDDGVISAVEKTLRLNGEAKVKDSFTILNNNDGIGDNRNILKMIDLQESDVNGANSGSFQDIFNKTATEIGATVRSSQMELENAESSKDEAIALEDEKSGVSLDEEAASLIQFQQAFSANARIIQTARELFDSLLRVVS